jgi:putative ABC transport system permease protein
VTRHLFRLAWNRRRRNALILAEIVVSFLLLCALFTVASSFFLNWNEPLGFAYHDVWRVSTNFGPYSQFDEEQQAATRKTLGRIEHTIAQHDDVVAASLLGNLPYGGSRRTKGTYFQGELIQVRWTWCRVSSPRVMGYELIEGRWFEEADLALEDRPIVITQNVARTYWGTASPLEKILPREDEHGDPEELTEENTYRVIGIVRDVRGQGEHQPAELMAFDLFDYDNLRGYPPGDILAKVRPGSAVDLEEELLKTAQRLAPSWTFSLERLEDVRSRTLRDAVTPILVLGVIAGFLVLMVGLGLTGVLWQAVARRTNEIGLRRAVGSTSNGARSLILGELMALATLAVSLGTVIYLQFPLLGLLEEPWPVIAMALSVSLAVMYGFVTLCGLYPSWLATRIEPARALMYE